MTTKFSMCDICKNVLKQFKEKNANISINIIEGKGKYENE